MIETLIDASGPAIPAVMRLRARYRGNRAAYAADKIRRNRQVGIFKRPSTGDRLDNAAARNHWRKAGPAAERAAQIQAQHDEALTRRAKHIVEGTKPYRGSKTEAEHRKK
jgi:ribosomal protein L39E